MRQIGKKGYLRGLVFLALLFTFIQISGIHSGLIVYAHSGQIVSEALEKTITGLGTGFIKNPDQAGG